MSRNIHSADSYISTFYAQDFRQLTLTTCLSIVTLRLTQLYSRPSTADAYNWLENNLTAYIYKCIYSSLRQQMLTTCLSMLLTAKMYPSRDSLRLHHDRAHNLCTFLQNTVLYSWQPMAYTLTEHTDYIHTSSPSLYTKSWSRDIESALDHDLRNTNKTFKYQNSLLMKNPLKMIQLVLLTIILINM